MFQTLDGEEMDPNDVSWMDEDEDMNQRPRVRSVNTRQRARPSIEASEFEVCFYRFYSCGDRAHLPFFIDPRISEKRDACERTFDEMVCSGVQDP